MYRSYLFDFLCNHLFSPKRKNLIVRYEVLSVFCFLLLIMSNQNVDSTANDPALYSTHISNINLTSDPNILNFGITGEEIHNGHLGYNIEKDVLFQLDENEYEPVSIPLFPTVDEFTHTFIKLNDELLWFINDSDGQSIFETIVPDPFGKVPTVKNYYSIVSRFFNTAYLIIPTNLESPNDDGLATVAIGSLNTSAITTTVHIQGFLGQEVYYTNNFIFYDEMHLFYFPIDDINSDFGDTFVETYAQITETEFTSLLQMNPEDSLVTDPRSNMVYFIFNSHYPQQPINYLNFFDLDKNVTWGDKISDQELEDAFGFNEITSEGTGTRNSTQIKIGDLPTLEMSDLFFGLGIILITIKHKKEKSKFRAA